jgi:hypothetical protein
MRQAAISSERASRVDVRSIATTEPDSPHGTLVPLESFWNARNPQFVEVAQFNLGSYNRRVLASQVS